MKTTQEYHMQNVMTIDSYPKLGMWNLHRGDYWYTCYAPSCIAERVWVLQMLCKSIRGEMI